MNTHPSEKKNVMGGEREAKILFGLAVATVVGKGDLQAGCHERAANIL